MLSNLELIVGTYEDYLVGYKIVEKPSKVYIKIIFKIFYVIFNFFFFNFLE